MLLPGVRRQIDHKLITALLLPINPPMFRILKSCGGWTPKNRRLGHCSSRTNSGAIYRDIRDFRARVLAIHARVADARVLSIADTFCARLRKRSGCSEQSLQTHGLAVIGCR
jgi:hypothetical protein